MRFTINLERMTYVFPKDINVMLFGTFLTRIGYFMVWPYLAVILYKNFNLSASSIGFVFFFAILISTLLSVFISHKSDQYGRKPIILLGLTLSILSFFYLPFCTTSPEFTLCVTGISLGRAFIESCSKAYIGDRLKNAQKREACQYFRYFIANIGVSIGPFIGTKFGIEHSVFVFYLTAMIYFLYMGLIVAFMVNIKNTPGLVHKINFWSVFNDIVKNRTFSIFILCNIIVMIIYATFDSTFIQYLSRENIVNLTDTIAFLVMLNALTVIFLQLPLVFVTRKITPPQRILLGVFLISAAQLIFCVANVHVLWHLIVATLVLSIGEIIVMPTINVEVDRLVPAEKRGIAFGITNFTNLGTSLSPLIGGFILQYFSGKILFLVMFILGMLASFLYYKSVVYKTGQEYKL